MKSERVLQPDPCQILKKGFTQAEEAMPMHPDEMTDSDDSQDADVLDPQDIINKFDLGLAVSDKALLQMDRPDFRDWMVVMTEGIACLADQCLKARAIAEGEMDKSPSPLESLNLFRRSQKDRIAEWRQRLQCAVNCRETALRSMRGRVYCVFRRVVGRVGLEPINSDLSLDCKRYERGWNAKGVESLQHGTTYDRENPPTPPPP